MIVLTADDVKESEILSAAAPDGVKKGTESLSREASDGVKRGSESLSATVSDGVRKGSESLLEWTALKDLLGDLRIVTPDKLGVLLTVTPDNLEVRLALTTEELGDESELSPAVKDDKEGTKAEEDNDTFSSAFDGLLLFADLVSSPENISRLRRLEGATKLPSFSTWIDEEDDEWETSGEVRLRLRFLTLSAIDWLVLMDLLFLDGLPVISLSKISELRFRFFTS
jgi:hypothetical protein